MAGGKLFFPGLENLGAFRTLECGGLPPLWCPCKVRSTISTLPSPPKRKRRQAVALQNIASKGEQTLNDLNKAWNAPGELAPLLQGKRGNGRVFLAKCAIAIRGSRKIFSKNRKISTEVPLTHCGFPRYLTRSHPQGFQNLIARLTFFDVWRAQKRRRKTHESHKENSVENDSKSTWWLDCIRPHSFGKNECGGRIGLDMADLGWSDGSWAIGARGKRFPRFLGGQGANGRRPPAPRTASHGRK